MRTTLTACAAIGLLSLVAGQASAAPILLDFSSGAYANEQFSTFGSDTYNQSGFKLTVMAPGNHLDPGGGGVLTFHNGPVNPVEDNDLILTYSGGAFDFNGVNIVGFDNFVNSLELFGSGGQFLSTASTGFTATPTFTNVTFVRFSLPITVSAPSGVTFDSMLVNNAPVAEIPEPASMVLFGLGALGCAGAVRRRRNLLNAA